jgi:hypothetical protein
MMLVCAAVLLLEKTPSESHAGSAGVTDFAYAQQSAETLYLEFSRLSPDEQRARYFALDANSKKELLRAHGTWWLRINRHRLSQIQIRVVEEGIAFCSELFSPETPDRVERAQVLSAKFTCAHRWEAT